MKPRQYEIQYIMNASLLTFRGAFNPWRCEMRFLTDARRCEMMDL